MVYSINGILTNLDIQLHKFTIMNLLIDPADRHEPAEGLGGSGEKDEGGDRQALGRASIARAARLVARTGLRACGDRTAGDVCAYSGRLQARVRACG